MKLLLIKGFVKIVGIGGVIHLMPPGMMVVITTHKLMGLLMTNSNRAGSARAIQAACQIGEAIE